MTRRRPSAWGSLVVLLSLACGCTSTTPAGEGNEGEPCFANGTCYAQLVCNAQSLCERRATTDAGGASRDQGGGAGCPCDLVGALRCAGEAAQTCGRDQRWQTSQTCGPSTTCVRGKCVEGGSGCPSRGEYDGVAIVGEIRDAVAVTGCRLGDGKPVAYTEDRAEEHAREVVLSAPGCANPSASLNLSTVFGLDVSAKVSSTTTGTSPTVVVPQNRFWTAYRQTVRLHRFATLWNGSRYVGYASVTDWRYDKVIATGNQCPVPSPLPAKWLSTEKLCLLAKMNCTCP